MAHFLDHPLEEELQTPSLFDFRTTYKTEKLNRGSIDIHLSDDGVNFTKAALACKLADRRKWPLFRNGGFASITLNKYSNYPATKVINMDLPTFRELFEHPEALAHEIEERSKKLAKLWNEKQGGSKLVGKRQQYETIFKIKDVIFPYGNQEHRSQLVLILSTWARTKRLQYSRKAQMRLHDIKISLKIRSSLVMDAPRGWQEEDLLVDSDEEKQELPAKSKKLFFSRFGLYMDVIPFCEFIKSSAMSDAIKAYTNICDKLKIGDGEDKRYTMIGDEEEEELHREEARVDKKRGKKSKIFGDNDGVQRPAKGMKTKSGGDTVPDRMPAFQETLTTQSFKSVSANAKNLIIDDGGGH